MDIATKQFHDLIDRCVQVGASDLHISSGAVPYLRVDGRLEQFGQEPSPASQVEAMALALMQSHQREVFDQRQTLDLAYSLPTGERFRINVFRERGHVAMAIRKLDQTFHTLEQLYLPKGLHELAELRDGLVLVTGPTGSGKTTTLATLLHQINCDRACHIITIEDPVEYIHQNEQSLIHQRELYTDVPDFAEAVRAAMREDPDVILVGEMRDTQTMRAAIIAAETGHLVFSTLHTGDAVGAVNRMLGVFSAEEQDSIRHQLSMVLKSVVAQRLLIRRDLQGRVPAVEILHVTTAVSHLIRSGKSEQIYSSIESGTAVGMQTMEQSLAELVVRGFVSEEDAFRVANHPQLFEARLRQPRKLHTGAGKRGII